MAPKQTSDGRDERTGRFLTGNIGGGRKVGSRNKLTTEFIDDLYAKWRKHGKDVLDRVIKDDPAAFLRTVAQILPKELDATLNVNVGLFAAAKDFHEAYSLALKHIGAQPALIEASREKGNEGDHGGS
jgi:hypothetical protein